LARPLAAGHGRWPLDTVSGGWARSLAPENRAHRQRQNTAVQRSGVSLPVGDRGGPPCGRGWESALRSQQVRRTRADSARTEPERSCLSAAEDDGACGEIVQPTIVTIEDDSGNDENDQQCPDEGLEHSGDVSVEASHLDSEDPMAHRVAEGADEQEVLES